MKNNQCTSVPLELSIALGLDPSSNYFNNINIKKKEDNFPSISHVPTYLGINRQFVPDCLFQSDRMSKSLWKGRDIDPLWNRFPSIPHSKARNVSQSWRRCRP